MIYTIEPGDNLSRIARQHDISLTTLLSMNTHIDNPDRIQIGGKINLPDKVYEKKYSKEERLQGRWMAYAYGELNAGIKEIPGRTHLDRIIEYHSTTTLKATDDETPWCSSFVNWCMKQAGYSRTKSASARSWLKYGEKIKIPRPGCIVVLRRGKSSWQGHTGFFTGYGRKGYIKVLGGNQSDSVSIAEYPESKVIGYRWPVK